MTGQARTLLAAGLMVLGAAGTARGVGQLHAYFPLDEGSGTTTTDVFGGQVGTLTNFGAVNPWTTQTAPLSIANPAALEFGANNGFANLGDLGFSSGAISLWVRPTNVGADTRLFSHVTGPIAQSGSTRSIGSGIQLWNGGAWLGFGGGPLGENVWQHLVFNSDGMTTDLYVDGTLQGSVGDPLDFDGEEFGLGARFLDSFGTPFEGQIDDLAFFSELLSEDEISALAGGASVLPPPEVPEPGSAALFTVAVAGMGLFYWRRRAGG